MIILTNSEGEKWYTVFSLSFYFPISRNLDSRITIHSIAVDKNREKRTIFPMTGWGIRRYTNIFPFIFLMRHCSFVKLPIPFWVRAVVRSHNLIQKVTWQSWSFVRGLSNPGQATHDNYARKMDSASGLVNARGKIFWIIIWTM